MPGDEASVPELSHNLQILKIQEERVSAYEDFEAAIRALIAGGAEEDYEKACAGITQRFKSASEHVNSVDAALLAKDTAAAKGLSSWIRKLQSCEKDKLFLTVASHIERKRLAKIRIAVEASAKRMAEHKEHAPEGASCACVKKQEADKELDELALEVASPCRAA
eukprot:977932-Rhodomonas_salina.2